MESIAVSFDSIDEVCENVFLDHCQRSEVFQQVLRQLSLVHSGPCRHLEVALISPQGIDLQLVQVNVVRQVRGGGMRVGGIVLHRLIERLATPLPRAGRLDGRLVELANIHMLGLRVDSKT